MAPVVVTSYIGRLHHAPNDSWTPNMDASNRLLMTLERTNYSFKTNVTIGSWEKTVPTDLMSWQDYYRTRFVTNDLMAEPPPMPGMIPDKPQDTNIYYNVAVELNTKEFPIAAESQSPSADVLLALSRYQQTLEELQQAGQRPYSRFPINYTATNPMEIFLPHLQSLKGPAKILQLRAIAKLQAGQTEAAMQDIKLMLRLADSVHSEPFLISHLVRIAVIDMTLQPVWEGLVEQRWSDAELKTLTHEFQQVDLVSDLEFTLHGERAALLGDIEYFKSHRSESAGFLLFAICPRFFEKLQEFLWHTPNLPERISQLLEVLGKLLPEETLSHGLEHLPPTGWYDQNKVSLAKVFQTNLFALAEPSKHLISQKATTNTFNEMDRDLRLRSMRPGNALLLVLLPAVNRSAQRFAQAQNSVDMALLACALERYRLVHGEYPETLTALVPSILEKIPPDVVNGESLHYQRTSIERFKLYSIGWNGKDDGGIIGTNQFGRYDPKSGDWVWQYPAKPDRSTSD